MSLALSLTTALSTAPTSGGAAVELRSAAFVALLVASAVLTSMLLLALTRTRVVARRAARAEALAIQRGEVMRAHLEQEGRTARREAQERLALIDALFRATPAGLAVFDRELRFVRLNQGLADMHGVPAGAHLGRRLGELGLATDPVLEEALQAVLQSGEARTVEVTGKPHLRSCLCNCAPVRDESGLVVGVATVFLDVTERLAAEREMRALVEALRSERALVDVVHLLGQQLAAELNLERLAQAVADAAAVVSGAQIAAFVYPSAGPGSAACMALAGPLGTHWRGLEPNRLLALHQALPAAPLRIADTLAASEPLRLTLAQLFEARFQEISSLVVVPISHARVPHGALLIVAHADVNVFSARDESALAGLSAQAAIALENARLYGEAEGLIRALAQSNRELDQFAYVASHDLKAPLRGIAHLASWLEEDLGSNLPQRSLDHLRLLRTRVTRLERMINGILHYSRAGRSEQEHEPVDVADLLHEVLALLHVPAQAEVHIGAMPLLLTERVPLQQVFMNLIGNALKYAKRQDVRVEVRCEPDDEAFLRFSVRDNGPGVAPENRERIWQIFAARSTDSESTGIGLAVVRKTVEARGGRAWVESTAQDGAAFHFTWPRRLAQGGPVLSHGTATPEH